MSQKKKKKTCGLLNRSWNLRLGFMVRKSTAVLSLDNSENTLLVHLQPRVLVNAHDQIRVPVDLGCSLFRAHRDSLSLPSQFFSDLISCFLLIISSIIFLISSFFRAHTLSSIPSSLYLPLAFTVKKIDYLILHPLCA